MNDSTRLRVAMDMTFPNRNPAGTGVYAYQLAEALRERDDVSLITVGASRRGLGPTASWLLYGAHSAVSGADIVHSPAGIAAWHVGPPHVVTIHDTIANEFPEDHPLEWRTYARWILPARAAAAAVVLVGSECLKKEVIDKFGLQPHRVAVTPYGIAQVHWTAERQRVHDEPILLFPGRPIRRKNLALVLDAMSHATTTSALGRSRLVITGADELGFPEHARRIQDLGLGARVRWMGRVPDGEMAHLIAAANVVVYPSLHEGFGFPAVEAMAAGTPVVASSAPCLPEVLGDGAILVDPRDVRAFSEAVESVLTDRGVRDAVVGRGRQRAAQYTWRRCAQLTVDAYREALNIGGRDSGHR